MDPRFEVLPPGGAPPSKPKQGFGGGVAALAILAFKFKTIATLLFSIWIYSFAWGWPFAIGFVLLIFVHELGHVAAAIMLGIPVSAPIFIPFMGAAIVMKQNPRDAWTEALMAYGGPLAGCAGGFVVWGIALHGNMPWLMAVARATFMINLFNLIPVPPLDGGRICAAVSPWFWIFGLFLLGASILFFFTSVISIIIVLIILFFALPRLKQTFLLRNTPEMQRYYRVGSVRRTAMAVMYVGLIVVLAYGLLNSIQWLTPPPAAAI